MKKKLFTSLACAAMVLVGALGLVGCGPTSMVSFNKVEGNYREKDITIAATTWTRQEDEEGYEEVYKMDKQTIEWNADALAAFPELNNGNIVALTFDLSAHAEDKDTYKIYTKSLKADAGEKKELKRETANEGAENTFIYFTSFTTESKGFEVGFDWDGDGEVDDNYKFIVDGSEMTFTPNPAV